MVDRSPSMDGRRRCFSVVVVVAVAVDMALVAVEVVVAIVSAATAGGGDMDIVPASSGSNGSSIISDGDCGFGHVNSWPMAAALAISSSRISRVS